MPRGFNHARTFANDRCQTFDDLCRFFDRRYKDHNPEPEDFALLSDNKEVLKAYHNMVTRSYEDKEQY